MSLRRPPFSLVPFILPLLVCGMPGLFGPPSAAYQRNDPEREKTPEDLAAIAASQAKRQRKAARKARSSSSPITSNQ